MSYNEAKVVLVVDDDLNILITSQMILETLGYSPRTATSGAEALVCLKNEPNQIDLILTDMSMPDMDGPQLLEKLRNDGYAGPVVLVSGHVVEEEDVSSDFAGIIFKPFQIETLATKLEEILAN